MLFVNLQNFDAHVTKLTITFTYPYKVYCIECIKLLINFFFLQSTAFWCLIFFSKVWNFSRIKIVVHFGFCILDPVMSEWTVDVDRRIYKGIQMGMDRGFIQKGDPVIIITGWKPGSGSTNTMRIINAVDVANKDLLAPITGERLCLEFMIHDKWCRSITMSCSYQYRETTLS